MANSKRYYWIKLEETFFDSLLMKTLLRMENGKNLQRIYLQMMLLSLKNSGCIYYQEIGESILDEISMLLNEDIQDIQALIEYLAKIKKAKLIDGKIYLVDVEERVGAETAAAVRMRKARNKVTKKEQCLHSDEQCLHSDEQCSHSVTIERDKNIVDKNKGERAKKIQHPTFDVPISEKRYRSLCKKYGEKVVDNYIQKVIDYSESKGKSYKDYAATAASWMDKNKVQPQPKASFESFDTFHNREEETI